MFHFTVKVPAWDTKGAAAVKYLEEFRALAAQARCACLHLWLGRPHPRVQVHERKGLLHD